MADDEYNKKLESLQQYIPFLDNMILQLRDPTKKNREQQLTKMQSLHAMITDKRKKLKLETLVRCEDVISKLYEKVHNRPIGAAPTRKNSDSPSFTPASPSPTRDFIAAKPLTIPMERLSDGGNRFPRVDVYSSAAESLSRPRSSHSGLTLGARVPDMSKPPISLEDLKTLEDDVHDKINETSLKSASLNELNNLRDMIAEQIHIEDVKSKSPQTCKKEETINTTVRNNLNLTKKAIQPPDKPKVNEKMAESPKTSNPSKTKDTKSVPENNPEATPPKKESKISPIQLNLKPKSPKILKEPASIFGSILSNIDGQILEGKKKKEERRSSLPGKDERRTSDSGKDGKPSKSSDSNKTGDAKKREERRSSSSSKDEKKSEDKAAEAKKKSEKSEKSSSKDSKSKDFSLSGKKTYEEQEQNIKHTLEKSHDKNTKTTKDEKSSEKSKESLEKSAESKADKEKEKDTTKNKVVTGRITVKKDLELKQNIESVTVENKEEPVKTPVYKRLADKYNPKPRKSTLDADVDKAVSDSIEEKMRMAPPKMPLINQIPAPVPPPPSLLLCSQAEPERTEPSPQLPAVLQNILNPSTTQLINTVVSQLRQTNAEAEAQKAPLLPTPPQLGNQPSLLGNPPLLGNAPSLLGNPPSVVMSSPSMMGNAPMLMSPPDKFVSREDNFMSDYARDNFTNDDFTNAQMTDFSNRQMRNERLRFEPPDRTSNQFPPRSPRYIPPLMGERFNENFAQNRQFSSHQPIADMYQQSYNYNQNNVMDMQPLDYYPPNAPIPTNQYNSGPPLLSPEIPHFHEQKPNNFGMMSNQEFFGHNEDMLWRVEDARSYWERRDQDLRINRDPRTYREYREMRESRDPRVAARENRDSRDTRDNRDSRESRDPRVNRDNRDRDYRDPRLNKGRDTPRDKESDRDSGSRFRDNRSQSSDYRRSRYDSKFDRIYSRTNRDRSRSRSRSRQTSQSQDTFTSPLDSLYSGKEESKTGKGYGVQNFRIPKIKKEDEKEKDDESTKVTSTNEELNEVHDDDNDTTADDDTAEIDDAIDTDKVESKEDVIVEGSIDQSKAVEEVKEAREADTDKIILDSTRSEKEIESIKETERKDAETIKADSQPHSTESEAKPADQTILAQFFANLLGSRNKRDKKTALYSLISTFSDSFSEKELSKITKIIKAHDEEEDNSSEEEEEPKKPAQKPDEDQGATVPTTNETEKDNIVKTPKQKAKKRARRISSGSPTKDEKSKDLETAKSPERSEVENKEEDSVVVTVGERIKSRKRASATSSKPKKRCRTELDMLHEDIQDMFIRDGVLTASGKRMCRILKDDPTVLSAAQPKIASPEDAQKPQRKKPGPKPKLKMPNPAEVKVMKSVRVVIPKMPDSSISQKEEVPKRNLRRSTRNVAYAESDDDDSLVREETPIVDVESLIEEESVRDDESEIETSDTEKDKSSQSGDSSQKSKMTKRKRGKSWASGVIPTSKKKKKKQSSVDEPEEAPVKKDSESDQDKSFVEPDKNYFIDSVSNKSVGCRLCNYHGRFITTHYKTQHPDSEILPSRLSPTAAEEAIKDSKQNLARYESLMTVKGGAKFQFVCRFCEFSTNVPPTLFYDHITTHTGEYRHICPTCEFSASSGKTLKSHMANAHQNVDKRVARKSFGQTIVFGYMCGECNYIQLTQKNVEDHINIFHLEKPTIYKINLSTYLDPEIEKASGETEAASESAASKETTPVPVEEQNEEEQQADIPKATESEPEKVEQPVQQRKKPGPKPGPKCSKNKIKKNKAKQNKKNDSITDSNSAADGESIISKENESVKVAAEGKSMPVTRRRLTKEKSVEEEVLPAARSRRAAKEKATEKLRFLMEATEGTPRKKSVSGDEGKKPEDKTKPSEEAHQTSLIEGVKQTPSKEESKETPQIREEPADKTKENIEAKDKEVIEPEKPKEEKLPEVKPVIKKEVEMNVFTCKTDIQEENKKIEQERLQRMEELNKSVGSRTSLNFVEKLCNRLNKSNIVVKQEPQDDLTDSLFTRSTENMSPLVMPVLEKEKNLRTPTPSIPSPSVATTPPPKKPVLETEAIQVSKSNFDVIQKNDKLISDMILKLKGKLKGACTAEDQMDNSIAVEDTDYDSEGPPPLRHVNELVNVKPSDSSTRTLLVGGLVKVIKNSDSLMFCCLVPPCVFSTEKKDAFQDHCRGAHKQSHLSITSTLCEMCGVEVAATKEATLLENLFKHTITDHADFLNNKAASEETPVKPVNRVLRLRKLSGDSLSVIKSDWTDESEESQDNAADKETDVTDTITTNDKPGNNKDTQSTVNNTSVSEVAVSETPTTDESPATMVELDMSEDNPFPFKIAGVMSLAEPQPPPLAPIAKPGLQLSPGTQLIVKEAKLSQAEIGRPRKTAKAMAKFIASVSDLYKCPHYYCNFSSNYRDFLERHLRAHKVDHESMIACVYCDMKTPWDHVPMHIDIRHAHCRFSCSYCLYRAVLKDYVFIHQDQMHPESDYSVIALPQPKHSKKFAIAEVKIDPKTLCEPYRCTRACNVEFLFENEFKKHLQDVHRSGFVPCGYKNCSTRVLSLKMTNHWSMSHCVSIYQCGYCKKSYSDITKMYQHFAQFHQGQQPDILIRMLTPMQEGVTMGYTPEAFSLMRKVVNLPSNLISENKSNPTSGDPLASLYLPPTIPYKKPATFKPAAPFTKATLQVVTSLPQTMTKSVLIPSNAGINRTITFVSTSPSTSGTSNILFLSTPTTGSSLGSIVVAQQSPIVTTIAPLSNPVTEVPALEAPTTAVPPPVSAINITPPPEKETTAEPSNEQNEQDSAQDGNLIIEPLEHITLGEDNPCGVDDGNPGEIDPLSLDADLTDAAKSAADGFSSDDESDESKVEKAKKITKGLLGYQLYRCSFCDISFSNSNDLRKHVTRSLTCRKEDGSGKPFVCVHCGKCLKNPYVLMDHIQCHGVLRFSCSLCGSKFPTAGQARSHAKVRHNINQTSMTPLNPNKTNIDTDEYVVRPKLVLQPSQSKETASSEPSTSTTLTENVYTPDQIDKIPMRHILSSSIKCGLCSYATKVRTNMVRHLQFHSEEKAVSDTAPVNPVPCLEKNEKMFDKMINLASSSHTGSRMGGANKVEKEKEAENVPEFVPTHCRYVCSAQDCNYLCPEEANLRHHIIALHESETSFTCVHCKTNLTQTDADSLIKHFKLHGLQLYKCQYCSFVHNLKHKVEKHVTDAHLDMPVKVITVRCLESEPKDQEASAVGTPNPVAPAVSRVNKPWRCCMCKYKSGSQEGIQQHALDKHEIDSQIKCALCTYKSNDKDSFTSHFKDVHDNQTIDIIYVYRKMEEDKEKEGGAFDTTPLWQRDRPRVRHIRGILFDDSTPVVTKSPKKTAKATAVASGGPSNAKILSSPVPSTSKSNTNLDLSIEAVATGTADILKEVATPQVSDEFFETVDKFVKDSTDDTEEEREKDSDVIIIDDDDDKVVLAVAKNKDNKTSPVAKNRPAKRKNTEAAGVSKMLKLSDEVIDLDGSGSDTEHDEFSERNLKLQFGGFGAPLNRQLKCPTCNQFKSKRISDFIFHLFKEMKVYRFKCKICADESITYRYMYKHVQEHKRNDKCDEDIISLPPNRKLEVWLQMVIREQSLRILQNFSPAPDPGTPTNKNLVKCYHCDRKYQSEQERNEHAIIHWSLKPLACAICKFSAYSSKEVEKHYELTHPGKGKPNIISKAPTVAKELEMSDDLHMREVSSTKSPKDNPSSPEKSPLIEEDPLRISPVKNTGQPAEGARETAGTSDLSSEIISISSEVTGISSTSSEVGGATVIETVNTVASEKDDDDLCENDLVIVTKTDSNVPKETDVYCCEYCPFMANSDVQITSHISGCHEHMHIKFKVLNRLTCESNVRDYVGCMVCSEVGSEIKIRQHHLEKHERQTFILYRFTCALCEKKFLKLAGLKMHFNKLHPGITPKYAPLQPISTTNSQPKEVKTSNLRCYKCPLCSYQRNFPPNSLNNVRSHVRQHFKAFTCGLCPKQKFKTRGEALAHFSKEHPGMAEKIIQDAQQNEEYQATMTNIIRDAVPVTETPEVVGKSTARKSTSAPFQRQEEYSFYGNQREQVDLNKIMTTMEVNGMCVNMSAEKLSKIFDLDAYVTIEDCNLGINLSSLFDS